MKAIDWILRCYPPRWRERYQEEIVALLEQHTITTKTLLDLLLGALDARLDPTYRSKDGFMFQNIRDMRSLSILYVCALTRVSILVNLLAYIKRLTRLSGQHSRLYNRNTWINLRVYSTFVRTHCTPLFCLARTQKFVSEPSLGHTALCATLPGTVLLPCSLAL